MRNIDCTGEVLVLKEPHQLNEEPILFDNEKLYFYQDQYDDGTTAIICKTKTEYPYAEISMDMSKYDCKYSLKYNEIVLNHNLPHELKDIFYKQICSNLEYSYIECPIIEYKLSYSNIVQICQSSLIKTYDGIIKNY